MNCGRVSIRAKACNSRVSVSQFVNAMWPESSNYYCNAQVRAAEDPAKSSSVCDCSSVVLRYYDMIRLRSNPTQAKRTGDQPRAVRGERKREWMNERAKEASRLDARQFSRLSVDGSCWDSSSGQAQILRARAVDSVYVSLRHILGSSPSPQSSLQLPHINLINFLHLRKSRLQLNIPLNVGSCDKAWHGLTRCDINKHVDCVPDRHRM